MDNNFLESAISGIKNTVLNIIKVENNLSNDEKVLDHILNSLFTFSDDSGLIFVQWCFVVLLLYSQYIVPEDKVLEKETYIMYDCIISLKNKSNYKINFHLEDSLYLLISSILQSYIKMNENQTLLLVLDTTLTKNIDRIQKNRTIDYIPMKTPIIREILPLIIPLLDLVNFTEFTEF